MTSKTTAQQAHQDQPEIPEKMVSPVRPDSPEVMANQELFQHRGKLPRLNAASAHQAPRDHQAQLDLQAQPAQTANQVTADDQVHQAKEAQVVSQAQTADPVLMANPDQREPQEPQVQVVAKVPQDPEDQQETRDPQEPQVQLEAQEAMVTQVQQAQLVQRDPQAQPVSQERTDKLVHLAHPEATLNIARAPREPEAPSWPRSKEPNKNQGTVEIQQWLEHYDFTWTKNICLHYCLCISSTWLS